MKKLIGTVIATLVLAGIGIFALWFHRDHHGLIVGVVGITMALGIALPAELRKGTKELKDFVVLIVPVVVGALKGGGRATDPPADEPEDEIVS